MILDEIKHDRLSEPERFLLDIFDGMVDYVSDKYSDCIFYEKDNNVMFEYDQKSQHLWYSYLYIRIVFSDEFNFNYQEINGLVQSMVETNLKLSVKTSSFKCLNPYELMEANLKLSVKIS